MSKRAYYDYRRDVHKRDIHVIAAELHKCNIPYKLTIDSLRVGDNTLMRYEDGTRSGWFIYDDPIFNSYNDALRWLIGDRTDLYVSDSGNIVITQVNFSPIPRKVNFSWTHDPSRILARTIPAIKRIEINSKKGVVYTTVIWEDGSKPTVVKKSEDDPHDPYFAVASAIAIKAYGSNSAFKREIAEKFELKNQVYGYGFEDLPSLIDTSLR